MARAGLLCLFFASGAAGLVLEVVWMRRLHLLFGSTALATAAVTGAFMAGLALGAWLAARRGDRAARPLRWYGALELAIGVYALAIPVLLTASLPVYRALAGLAGGSALALDVLRFGLAFVVLAPATTAMGATLPLLVRQLSNRVASVERATAGLYAANTAGAFVGVLVGGYGLLPHLGEWAALRWAVGVDVAIGLGALAWSRRAPPVPAEQAAIPAPAAAPGATWVLALLGLSGFAALACQVAWTRLVALVLGSSVYAFTAIVAAVLAGIAGGSAVACALPAPGAARHRALAVALLVAGAAVSVGPLLVEPGIWLVYRWTLAGSDDAYWRVQLVASACLIFPASLAFGAVPPLAVRTLAPEPLMASRWVGRAFGCNTVGALAGATLGGLALLPVAGMQGTLVIAGGLTAAAGVVAAWRDGGVWLVGAVTAAVGIAVVGATTPAWTPGTMVSQPYVEAARMRRDDGDYADRADYARSYGLGYHRPLVHHEGANATVTVMESPWHLVLHVDGKPDASAVGDMETQVLLGHLPMLLHPGPRDVLVIGWGSGVTVGAAARHPGAQVTCVEIEPAVPPAARVFDHVSGAPLDRANVRVITEDARTLLLADAARYDVVISEPSNPWLSGPAKLFTREFFESVRARLRPGGVLGQWVHLYGLDLAHFQAIVRTFGSVFPDVRIFQTIDDADLLLLGGTGGAPVDWAALEQRAARPDIAGDLAAVDSDGAAGLCSRYVAGPDEAARLAGEGPLNTDDNGLVEYGAGWTGWRKHVAEAVSEAVRGTAPAPGPLLGDAPGPGLAAALAAMAAAALERRDRALALHWAKASVAAGATPAGRRVLARAWDAQDKALLAEVEYQAAVKLDPADLATRRAYAQSLVASGDHEPALAVASEPPSDDPVLAALAGVALRQLGRPAEAHAAFERVPDATWRALPSGPRAEAGAAAVGAGDHARALQHLEAYLTVEPADREARRWLQRALSGAGRDAEAAALDRGLRALSGEPEFDRQVDALPDSDPTVLPLLERAGDEDPWEPRWASRLTVATRLRACAGGQDTPARRAEALVAGRAGVARFPGQVRVAVEHAYSCALFASSAADPDARRALYREAAGALQGLLDADPPDLDALRRREFEGRVARFAREAR